MHILLISHSSNIGGGERALLNLARCLKQGDHRVTVLVPKPQGSLLPMLAEAGAELAVMPLHSMLMRASRALIGMASTDFSSVERFIAEQGVGLVLTNTLAIWQGALAAARAGVPHVWYVHELFEHSPELYLGGIEPAYAYATAGQLSDAVIGCSPVVTRAFRAAGVDESRLSVIAPHQHSAVARHAGPAKAGEAIQINVVGLHIARKNAIFAVDVAASLAARGHDLSLRLVGDVGSMQAPIVTRAQRRGVANRLQFTGPVNDPYAGYAGRCVTLVCSKLETFGLTVVESMARAIPVVASRCGGPETLLPDASLFPVDDLDACVRAIEAVVADWPAASLAAASAYETQAQAFDAARQASALEAVIARAVPARPKTVPAWLDGARLLQALTLPSVNKADVMNNVSAETGIPVAEIVQRVQHEAAHSGAAVAADCARFDVVPFGHSTRSDTLYRDGAGFAIELLAHHDDPARQLMATFCATRLHSKAWALQGAKPRVLALGDGIGIDSMRMASLGFDLSYVDFDSSVTSRIARRNFATFAEHNAAERNAHAGRISVLNGTPDAGVWDAIICLEVIEHVPDPQGFLGFLASLLADDGLLLISECFEGVEARWPTHLVGVERWAGLLPLMAASHGLELVDCNTDPHGKPYAFRKAAKADIPALVTKQMGDVATLRHLLATQQRVRDELR